MEIKPRIRKDFLVYDDVDCDHIETEKRFVGYHFTEELFANYCKKCNKQLTTPKS